MTSELKEEGEGENKKSVRVGASNFLSHLFFVWVFRLIWLVRRLKDLDKISFYLRHSETSRHNDQVLEKKWREELERAAKAKKKPLIRNAIIRAYGFRFVLNGLWKIVWEIALWFGAYWLLKQTIEYVRAQSSNRATGHLYALGFFLSSFVVSLSIHQLISNGGCLGLRLKSALMVQIFRKSLVLARIRGGAGDVVNLVSNDCQKLADACTNFHYLWSSVVEVTAVLCITFAELGYAASPALSIIVIMLPIQIWMGVYKSKIGYENTQITSRRVHIMTEILTAIKLIKFYAWEQPFYDRIVEIRKRELTLIKRNLILNSVNFTVVVGFPAFISLAVLIIYWKSGNTINPVIGFTIGSLFSTLRYPLQMTPLAVNSASDARSAMKRLDEFFSNEEIEPSVRHPDPTDSDETIVVSKAEFKWDKSGQSSDFGLDCIDFTAYRGKLVAVIGDIGSGKSSLLAALLGQMKTTSGEWKVSGSIGYVPQEAWLLNTTLRENILFGSPYDEKHYNKTIQVCALRRDLELMPNGDLTEIGERGINLSGGQRQRISLARCVYKMNDVILLDDPLSAVDQQVGRHIFTKCIKGLLKQKTVIFVTHQLQYLHQVDDILVMKNGTIIEHSSFHDLMRVEGGRLAKLVGEHVQIVDEQQIIKGKSEDSMIKTETDSKEDEDNDDQIIPEDAEPMKLVLEDQSVFYNKSPVMSYLRAAPGLFWTILMIVFFFFVYGMRLVIDWWQAQWYSKSSGKYPEISDDVFVGLLALFTVVNTILLFLRGLWFALSSYSKSTELHNKMFKSVVYAVMNFFDTTPIGRVLNAFARHQYAIDAQLSDSLFQFLQFTPIFFGAMLLIISVMYQCIGCFAGAFILVGLILLYLGGVEGKLKNKDALTKSGIFGHLTATLEGLFSIRAYECQNRFVESFMDKIDENHKFQFAMMEVKCWLALYIDIVTSLLIYCTVVVIIELMNQYTAATSGLVLTSVLQLLVFLHWIVRMFGEVYEKMSSIKQVVYYGNAVKQEAPSIITSNIPDHSWPSEGRIQFINVVLKYQENGVSVLKNISIDIKPKEKIGIVGRTGSGKSSLLISLLRIVELSEGQIVIDEIDVGKIGLADLRSRVAIIPQEPILFVGTIRENVDLFDKSTDEEIWQALDSVHLGEFIRKLDQKLDSPVIENGKNFSVGQRQLFCIARAILSKTQILVLDEATAAVDLETDKLIQETIRANFSNFTVLTIAHRLNTIMESDKILVMDAGNVVEFDTPLTLLKDPNGHFTKLLKETGPESFRKLQHVAEEKFRRDENDVKIQEKKMKSNESENQVLSQQLEALKGYETSV